MNDIIIYMQFFSINLFEGLIEFMWSFFKW